MGFLFELCFKHLQIGKEENSAKFDYINMVDNVQS